MSDNAIANALYTKWRSTVPSARSAKELVEMYIKLYTQKLSGIVCLQCSLLDSAFLTLLVYDCYTGFGKKWPLKFFCCFSQQPFEILI